MRTLCLEQVKGLGASSQLHLSRIIPECWPGLAPIVPRPGIPIAPAPPMPSPLPQISPRPHCFRPSHFPRAPHFHSPSGPMMSYFPPIISGPHIPQPPIIPPVLKPLCPPFQTPLISPGSQCPSPHFLIDPSIAPDLHFMRSLPLHSCPIPGGQRDWDEQEKGDGRDGWG